MTTDDEKNKRSFVSLLTSNAQKRKADAFKVKVDFIKNCVKAVSQLVRTIDSECMMTMIKLVSPSQSTKIGSFIRKTVARGRDPLFDAVEDDPVFTKGLVATLEDITDEEVKNKVSAIVGIVLRVREISYVCQQIESADGDQIDEKLKKRALKNVGRPLKKLIENCFIVSARAAIRGAYVAAILHDVLILFPQIWLGNNKKKDYSKQSMVCYLDRHLERPLEDWSARQGIRYEIGANLPVSNQMNDFKLSVRDIDSFVRT